MIIGIVGRARSGKDTVTEFILKRLPNSKQYAFAYPIKDCVNDLFGWGTDHSDGDLKEVIDPKWGFSPRHAYQTFGTEWGRNCLREDIWLKIAEVQCSYNTHTVISDVRFKNEAEWIKSMGGVLIHVVRPNNTESVKSHASENGIFEITSDFMIYNNSTLKDLDYTVEYILDQLNIQ